jgi:chromosome segregation ATPase
MKQGVPQGQIEQQLVSCQFCSTKYDLKKRRVIEPCYGCKLPLLPENPTAEMLEDYVDKLKNFTSTQYSEQVKGEIARVSSKVAQLKSSQVSRFSSPSPGGNAVKGAGDGLRQWEARLANVEGSIKTLINSQQRLSDCLQEVVPKRSELPKTDRGHGIEASPSTSLQDLLSSHEQMGTRIQSLASELSQLEKTLRQEQDASLKNLENKVREEQQSYSQRVNGEVKSELQQFVQEQLVEARGKIVGLEGKIAQLEEKLQNEQQTREQLVKDEVKEGLKQLGAELQNQFLKNQFCLKIQSQLFQKKNSLPQTNRNQSQSRNQRFLTLRLVG